MRGVHLSAPKSCDKDTLKGEFDVNYRSLLGFFFKLLIFVPLIFHSDKKNPKGIKIWPQVKKKFDDKKRVRKTSPKFTTRTL